jgi:hypothetical protein
MTRRGTLADTDSESKTKSDVYYERNLLALAFLRFYVRYHDIRGGTPAHGWWPDTDDVNGDEWAVVWVNTTEGQVGWHIPMYMVPDWLDKRDPEYDGYTTAAKNGRMARLTDLTEPTTNVDHFEWNGWLFCDIANDAFDWQTGEVTCPHCKTEFTVTEPPEEGV